MPDGSTDYGALLELADGGAVRSLVRTRGQPIRSALSHLRDSMRTQNLRPGEDADFLIPDMQDALNESRRLVRLYSSSDRHPKMSHAHDRESLSTMQGVLETFDHGNRDAGGIFKLGNSPSPRPDLPDDFLGGALSYSDAWQDPAALEINYLGSLIPGLGRQLLHDLRSLPEASNRDIVLDMLDTPHTEQFYKGMGFLPSGRLRGDSRFNYDWWLPSDKPLARANGGLVNGEEVIQDFGAGGKVLRPGIQRLLKEMPDLDKLLGPAGKKSLDKSRNVVRMTPEEFEQFSIPDVPDMGGDGWSLPELIKDIENGGLINPPSLYVGNTNYMGLPKRLAVPMIDEHDGRHRMRALAEIMGEKDPELPVIVNARPNDARKLDVDPRIIPQHGLNDLYGFPADDRQGMDELIDMLMVDFPQWKSRYGSGGSVEADVPLYTDPSPWYGAPALAGGGPVKNFIGKLIRNSSGEAVGRGKTEKEALAGLLRSYVDSRPHIPADQHIGEEEARDLIRLDFKMGELAFEDVAIGEGVQAADPANVNALGVVRKAGGGPVSRRGILSGIRDMLKTREAPAIIRPESFALEAPPSQLPAIIPSQMEDLEQFQLPSILRGSSGEQQLPAMLQDIVGSQSRRDFMRRAAGAAASHMIDAPNALSIMRETIKPKALIDPHEAAVRALEKWLAKNPFDEWSDRLNKSISNGPDGLEFTNREALLEDGDPRAIDGWLTDLSKETGTPRELLEKGGVHSMLDALIGKRDTVMGALEDGRPKYYYYPIEDHGLPELDPGWRPPVTREKFRSLGVEGLTPEQEDILMRDFDPELGVSIDEVYDRAAEFYQGYLSVDKLKALYPDRAKDILGWEKDAIAHNTRVVDSPKGYQPFRFRNPGETDQMWSEYMSQYPEGTGELMGIVPPKYNETYEKWYDRVLLKND